MKKLRLTVLICAAAIILNLTGCAQEPAHEPQTDTAPTSSTEPTECNTDTEQSDETTEEDTNHSTEAQTTTEKEEETTVSTEQEKQTATVKTEEQEQTTPIVTTAKQQVQTTTAVTTTKQQEQTTATPVTTTKQQEQTPAVTTKQPEQTTAAVTTKQEEQTTTAAVTTTEEQTTTAPETEQNTYTLSNPNADQKTKDIYKFICDSYGKNIISCQQESTWMGSPDYEMDYIQRTTGKLPAMRGLDFMNNDYDGVVRRAKEWSEKGGLVTICWHTGVESSGYQESLADDPDFDKLLTEGTEEYKVLMESWDKAAKALQELQKADVTVFWRPFHEFDGQWFWWGKGGADNFIALWQMMYDKFTNEYGLNNLIWVLGYSGDVKRGWYPGDEYCDIAGSDTYDNSTNSKGWKLLKRTCDKPLTFHECGNLPSVEDFERDGAMWSWFMVWHTNFITDNNKDNLSKVYNSDMVLTLDELPKL